MKHKLVALGIICLLSSAAAADYIDLPIKWSQVPYDTDPSFLPYANCVNPGVVWADDFECTDADPIVAVRWWGLYNDSEVHDTGYVTAHISFHYSTGTHPKSVPTAEDPIVLYEVQAQEEATGDVISWVADGAPIYRYDAYLPEPFYQHTYSQQSPNAGELFICLCIPGETVSFWMPMAPGDPHTPILDWAACSMNGHAGPWTSADSHLNLAFELMTPEPATMALLGLGLAGLALRRRRK